MLFGQATVRQPFYAMITSFIARREAPAATASAADSSDRDVFCDYLTDWIKLPRTTPRQHVCHVLSTSTDRCNVRISCHEQYLTPSSHAGCGQRGKLSKCIALSKLNRKLPSSFHRVGKFISIAFLSRYKFPLLRTTKIISLSYSHSTKM